MNLDVDTLDGLELPADQRDALIALRGRKPPQSASAQPAPTRRATLKKARPSPEAATHMPPRAVRSRATWSPVTIGVLLCVSTLLVAAYLVG